MKAEKISLIVDNVCRELGIPFCSTNPHYVTLQEDAQKMAKMYLQLKEMVGILEEIEERHKLNELKIKFDCLIKELDDCDHILIRLARELKDKNVD
jgi:hypothetical protein